jgi:hypothetical protein
MATTKLRYWTPDQTYDFQVIIGDVDYTPDLQRVTIITAIDKPYQTVIFDLFQDPNELILERVYGQEPIKLRIRLLTQTGEVEETVEMELFYLSTNYPLMTKSSDPQQDDKVRDQISLVTIVRNAYQIMTSLTTGLFFGETVGGAISTILSNVKGNPTLKLETEGANSEVIDQIIVPPMAFTKAVKYLDQTFGVFDGPMAFFCLFDGTVYIKNMNKKPKNSHEFTINFLTTDVAETQIIEQPLDGKSYYTMFPVTTSYAANPIYGDLGGYQRHVVKPKDTLSHMIDITMNTFSQTYGFIDKNNKIYADKEATGFMEIAGRTGIYTEHTGYEKTQHFINANMSRPIIELSMLYVTISSKNIAILNLMNVGESVKFSSKTSDYAQLTGKYILKNSTLSFNRLRDWEANADLQLVRTNRASQ